MSYDGRLLRLAQERYEADRSIREAEQAARREAIYTSRPRLREIDEELRRTASRVLAAALRELERDGLVRRQAHPEVPVRVEYSPTERCLRLLPVLESLSDWAEAEMGSGEGELPE